MTTPRHAATTGAPLSWLRAPSAKTRRYLYRISMALGPLLILYGVLGTEEWALWSGVVATVLDVPLGMADANVTDAHKRQNDGT